MPPSLLSPSPVFGAIIGRLTTLQLAILAGYFLLLIGTAFAFRKLNRSGDDYFRSGSQGTWWLVGMSTYMASFSAFTFTGLAGVAYRAGFSASTAFIANVVGFALNGLFLAAWLRQLRVTTMPEVIRDRYGPWAEQFYGWIGNLFGILYAAMTLYTLCIFASTVFGLPIMPLIVTVGLVVMFYSVLGGRWAVMGADFVQGMILIPITVLLAILCWRAIGGASGFAAAMTAQNLGAAFQFMKPSGSEFGESFTAPWVAANILALLMDRMSLNGASRYASCRDGREASRAAWLVAWLMLGSVFVFFLPPMVARMLFSSDIVNLPLAQPAEAAYAVAGLKLLPATLMGLMVVAIFAATLSTMDSGLNLFAAVFVKNIYPLICRLVGTKPREGSALVRLSEVMTFLSGLVIIGLACTFAAVPERGAFDIMLDLGALFSIPMVVPLVLALFDRGAPRHAATWAIVSGLAVSALGYLTGVSATVAGLVGRWSYDEKVFATALVGMVGFFCARLRPERDPAARQQREAFYVRMHRPVDVAAEVGAPQSIAMQARILSWLCLVAGTGVLALLLVEGPWVLAGRLGVLIIGLFLLGVAGLLRWVAARN